MIKVDFFQKDGMIDPQAIGAGVYVFKIGLTGDKEENYLTLYIGESYSMLTRCSQHLYEIFERDPAYFGLSDDHLKSDGLKLIAKVYQSIPTLRGTSHGDRDMALREKELEAVKKEKPLSQNSTNDNLRKDRVDVVRVAIDQLFKKATDVPSKG